MKYLRRHLSKHLNLHSLLTFVGLTSLCVPGSLVSLLSKVEINWGLCGTAIPSYHIVSFKQAVKLLYYEGNMLNSALNVFSHPHFTSVAWS